MQYKVLVLDIDGTLNNSNKIITPKTKSAIINAQKNGTIIVLASGRPTFGILPAAKELELDKFGGYILSYNGGKIINCKTGEIIYKKFISKNDVAEIYNLSKEMGVNILTYQNDTVISEKEDEFLQTECRISKVTYVKSDVFTDTVTFDVPKFLMVGDGDYLGKIEPIVSERLKGRFKVFRSEPFFLEIMPKNIDKAYSLGKLLEHLGLSKEEMIACGDGFNDVSMISYAGLGVAMENAQDVVKDVSDFITLSNDDDGIAHVIKRFILEKHIA